MNKMCFAMDADHECTVLEKRKCVGFTSCVFYKTCEKAQKDAERANERISALPMENQQVIADKYYKGKMPWRFRV